MSVSTANIVRTGTPVPPAAPTDEGPGRQDEPTHETEQDGRLESVAPALHALSNGVPVDADALLAEPVLDAVVARRELVEQGVECRA